MLNKPDKGEAYHAFITANTEFDQATNGMLTPNRTIDLLRNNPYIDPENDL